MKRQAQIYPSSLLQRLVDSNETAVMFYDLNDIYLDIKNNLQQLLNSRASMILVPSRLSQVKGSVINYGIHDFSNHYYEDYTVRQSLCQHIAEAVSHFEPRLSDIEVMGEKTNQLLNREIFIRIEAKIKPGTQHKAIFESNVDLYNQQFSFL